MVEVVCMEKHSKTYLTNNTLIKLIITHSQKQQGSTWTGLLAKSHAPTTETKESESE